VVVEALVVVSMLLRALADCSSSESSPLRFFLLAPSERCLPSSEDSAEAEAPPDTSPPRLPPLLTTWEVLLRLPALPALPALPLDRRSPDETAFEFDVAEATSRAASELCACRFCCLRAPGCGCDSDASSLAASAMLPLRMLLSRARLSVSDALPP
jgi:hypothetical protein